MKNKINILVTDASPLITLAAADALEVLDVLKLRIMVPDMVFYSEHRSLSNGRRIMNR